ncbi:MAG: hypothetical protein Q9207_006025 [Kuettlingeria erythrocarpa]
MAQSSLSVISQTATTTSQIPDAYGHICAPHCPPPPSCVGKYFVIAALSPLSHASITSKNPTHPTQAPRTAMSTSNNSNSSSKNPLNLTPAPPKDPRRPPIQRSKSHPAPFTSSAKPGEATAAYKNAQSKLLARESTAGKSGGRDGGSKASSQACESGEVSESERGIMRKDRKDVNHQPPGLGEWDGKLTAMGMDGQG